MPISTGMYTDKIISPNATATVHVLKPVFTPQDAWADYKAEVTLAECITMDWDDSGAHVIIPATSGEAPVVVPVITHMESGNTVSGIFAPTDDSNFQISSIIINGSTYANSFTVKENGCESKIGHAPDRSFTIHLNRYDLTVTKTVLEGYGTYGQSFIFDVVLKHGDETRNLSFSLMLKETEPSSGSYSASKTIVGIPCGFDVTVTEDTDWSWRYTPDDDNVTKTANSPDEHDTVSSGSAPTIVDVDGIVYRNIIKTNGNLWLTDAKLEENKFKQYLPSPKDTGTEDTEPEGQS